MAGLWLRMKKVTLKNILIFTYCQNLSFFNFSQKMKNKLMLLHHILYASGITFFVVVFKNLFSHNI